MKKAVIVGRTLYVLFPVFLTLSFIVIPGTYDSFLRIIKLYPYLFYGSLLSCTIIWCIATKKEKVPMPYRESVERYFCILWMVSWLLGFEAGNHAFFRKSECFVLKEYPSEKILSKKVDKERLILANSPFAKDQGRWQKWVRDNETWSEYKVIKKNQLSYIVENRNRHIKEIGVYRDIAAKPVKCRF